MKLPILTIALAAACSGQLFPIAGVVVDSQSGSTLNRAHVILNAGNAGQSGERSVITHDDGRFSFEVGEGKYTLTADYRSGRQVFGLAGPSTGYGSAIVTGPGQDTGHLIFRWFAPSAIFGRVIDDRGDPVENAKIQLIRESVIAGRRQVAASATITRTNDLGNYRIGPIAAGTYYLVAAAEPWYVKQTAVLSRMRREAGQTPPQDPAYAPTYYPNVTDPHAASPLVLKVGGEGRADFTLRTIVGANVHPVCANTTPEAENAQPNPLPNNPTNGFNADDFRRLQQFGRSNPIPNNRCPGSVNLYLHGIGDVETLFSTTYAGISDVVSGVPPGRYTVRYSAPGGTMRKVVDIGGGDVTVDLGALPAPSINGTVSLMNPGTAPKATMYVRLLNEVTGAAIARPIQQDGSFTWTNVPAGRYRPQVTSADGIFISSITASGAELKNGIIDLAEGMSVQLRVVASDETGRLKGFVRNGDKPAPAVLVVLAPRGGSTDPYDYAAFQSDSDGSFDFVNVRAGEYVLFSVEQLDFEYAKSDAVRPYLVIGKPIRVAPHGTYSESISVTLAGSTK